jgi:5-formyltetrahydrofolate cyclo-ligase
MSKDQIRINHKKLRNMLSLEEQNYYSCAIRERLFTTTEYQNCNHLFSFVSFDTEVDTIGIIQQAFLDKKKVYVPRVETHGMEFYEIQNLEGLIPSKFGVPEPPNSEETRYQSINHTNVKMDQKSNLMLLPGLAFDYIGNRIGYGAGYYDRYLSAYPTDHFYKMALSYDFQLLDQITTGEFDVKADAILTPTQRIQCCKL